LISSRAPSPILRTDSATYRNTREQLGCAEGY
jgi:hypothetical protein